MCVHVGLSLGLVVTRGGGLMAKGLTGVQCVISLGHSCFSKYGCSLEGGLDGGRKEKLITRKKPIENLFVILGSVYWCTFCR